MRLDNTMRRLARLMLNHHVASILPDISSSSPSLLITCQIHEQSDDVCWNHLRMSVGFGFSVGDFIAALRLVDTVVDALRESGRSSANFQELLAELQSLKAALHSVDQLQLHDDQQPELLALKQASAQCQITVENFWKRIMKYQPHLGATGTDFRLKSGWMKIKWAFCKKEDLARFKVDVQAHTQSIMILMLAIHM